jgi:hypothetical protein
LSRELPLRCSHDFVVELRRRASAGHLFKAGWARTDYSIVIPTRFSLACLFVVGLVSTAQAGPPAGSFGTAGCRCALSPEALLEQTDHIFIGDIVRVDGSGDEIGTAVIRVRENFKGKLAGLVHVRDAAATDCSWSVFEMAGPGRFVVFANLDEGELVTPAFCPQTQPLSGWQDKLAPFRAYARANRPATGPAPKAGS